MKEYLEVIAAISGDELERKKVIEEIEVLYFEYIRRWWKFIRFSEAYRLAADVIKIENSMRRRQTLAGVRLKSATLRADPLLGNAIREGQLTPTLVLRINDDVVAPYRFNVKAVIVAERLKQERRRAAMAQVTNILLGILSAIGAVISVLLAAYLKNQGVLPDGN